MSSWPAKAILLGHSLRRCLILADGFYEWKREEECVAQIRENPYLQYFCGLKEFIAEAPFNPSMYVPFRKRFPADILNRVNEAIVHKAIKQSKKDDNDTDEAAICLDLYGYIENN